MAISGNNASGQGVGLPLGAKVGKYEVVERSGMGGQAIVYKCLDKSLDRFVAIKQISPHLAEDPKFVERFRAEARILARLGAEGNGIVVIHELLEDPAGLFIVMEFVQGPTLEAVLQDTAGPMEHKAALQILWRLAAALNMVHAAGIVHRDLKPGNIIIAEGLRPTITDFGVAATRTGQTSLLLGTTKYMAPELFSGGDVDGRSDMYSLGMIAYETLLGRPRFQQTFEDIVRDPHSEPLRWMKWHSNEQESAPPLASLDHSMPQPLSDIVAKMMAKKRDDRFESMESLGRAIRAAFNPRAKAAAADAAALLAGPRRHAEAPAENGDELALRAQPATAPIPRKPLSLRAKIIIMSAGFTLLLVAVIAWVLKTSADRQQVETQAGRAYAKAAQQYDAGEMEEAIAGFEAVAAGYSGTRHAWQASVLIPLTKARLAEGNAQTAEQWEIVAQDAQNALNQLKKVQAQRKDLDKWAGELLAKMEDMDRNRLRLRKYRTEMARASEAFSAGQFDEAKRILSLLADLNDEQRKSRDLLRQQVDRGKFDRDYGALIAKGDQLGAPDDFQKDMDFGNAQAAYAQAKGMLDNSATPEGAILPKSDLEALSKALSAKMALLATKKIYQNARMKLNAAKNADERLAALRDMYEAARTPELAQQVRQAVADQHLQQAEDALKNKKPDDARTEAQLALKEAPDYPPAVKFMVRLDAVANRDRLINEGGALFAASDWAGALKKFLEAADFGDDESLAAKIVDARFQMQLGEADQLRDAKKWDDAVAAYKKARDIKPADAATVDAREDALNKAKAYYDAFAKGEKAMADKKYSTARGHYIDARKALSAPPPEVAQRIALATYMENIEQGKAASARRDYDAALAYFKIARNQQKDAGVADGEADKLIRDAEIGLKSSTP
jgi:hypothetical protein